MRHFIIISLIVFVIAGCTNRENRYREGIIPVIDNFNTEIHELTDIYNNLSTDPGVNEQIIDIQTGLYEVKLNLLSLDTPDNEEFLVFQNEFLNTIEEFELLTYKLTGLASLYSSKEDYSVKQDNFSYRNKQFSNKKSVVENLISIQEEDMRRTILSCRDLLTRLKKSSQFLDYADFTFPEFLQN